MSKATKDLSKILARLSKTVQASIDRVAMTAVGNFTVDLVVKRTRLGFGVPNEQKSVKQKLASLSPKYVLARKTFDGLDSTTTPKKSNLTRTGKMLRSVKSKYEGRGRIVVEPTGKRNDGYTNLEIAEFNADGGPGRPKRIFNRVTKLEFNQILRFYRKTFGDLVKSSSKGRLIR